MVACVGLAFLSANAGAAATPAATQPVQAVWREEHVNFFYRGRTARYSCDGLRDKMRALLLDLGARRDLQIVPLRCAGTAHARHHSAGASLSITFAAPALPDPARKPLHPGDLAATGARFEKFTITSDAFRNMGVGDCELVAEFTHQILPKLVTREVQHDINCVPYPLRGGRFWVRGEILRPLPVGNPSGRPAQR